MFEDFDKSKASKEGRGRMGVSFLISGALFAGIMAALAAAIATARVVIKRQQRDVQVAFPASRLPSAVPQERPEEAEGELADAGKVGPVEGFTDGEGSGGGGRGLPQQVTETIEEPKFLSGCRAPEVPDALTATAATVEIDVRMLIDARGLVRSAEVLKTHPLIPNELILECARAHVFRPAHLPDGTPVPYPFRRRFVFLPARV
jgi:hypothetical protein